jgi:LAO/AO transport system kinase
MDADLLIKGILAGDRVQLARAITLVESRAQKHFSSARKVIQHILPHSGGSIRIGLTGVPGCGKSTFIEAFGKMLCEQGWKVAVLAIDPSSSVGGGSILGDKTRMETLCREENAFIRPSPTGDNLGGVTTSTRESLLMCEAAGYDVVIVETVGVGQNETAVRTMTDFFLLLEIVGGGDDLQRIKKGVIELADLIVVNKADGQNRIPAQQTATAYAHMLEIVQPFTPGWKPQSMACSALENEGIDPIWKVICEFREQMTASGVFQKRRSEQNIDWFRSLVRKALMQRFTSENSQRIQQLEMAVGECKLSISEAVDQLLERCIL